jgi:hypothetical protein
MVIIPARQPRAKTLRTRSLSEREADQQPLEGVLDDELIHPQHQQHEAPGDARQHQRRDGDGAAEKDEPERLVAARGREHGDPIGQDRAADEEPHLARAPLPIRRPIKRIEARISPKKKAQISGG